MAFNIGVNVVEVDGLAPPRIVAAPTSVAGFLVSSERGVPDLPVPLRGFADFVASFGGYTSSAYGAFAVRGFFDNGGSNAWAVRVVGAGSAAAEVTLDDRAATGTLRVQAGQRGRPDPGAWGNQLAVTVTDHPRGTSAVPGQILGSAVEPFPLSDGDALDVVVNGAAVPVTVTFNAVDFGDVGNASASDVAAEINRQTTALKAAATPGNRLLLSSAAPGAASRLEVSGTAAATLGFAPGNDDSAGSLATTATRVAVQATGGLEAGTAARLESRGHVIATGAVAAATTDGAGIDVTADGGAPVSLVLADADFTLGVAAITAAEVVAAINRQAQGFTAALDDQDQLVLLSNSYGPGSSIAVAPGGVDATADLGLTGATPVAGAEVLRELTSVSEVNKTIAWTGALGTVLPAFASRVQSTEVDLAVLRGGVEVERFDSLSMQSALDSYAPAVVNDPESGSRFIRLDDLASGSPAGQDVPAVGTFALGATLPTAGADGSAPADGAWVGDPAARTGLHAFDPVDVQLLACPETTATAVATAAIAYCEGRGEAMFVGTVPQGLDLEGAKAYAGALRARKSFGALYGPWIAILNPLDTTGNHPRLWIPPVGQVLGTYARIAAARGVWKAPAGDEAQLRNVLAVELDMTDADHTDLVKNGGVNGIRAVPGSGIVVDASRTLSTDSRWLFVNVRRLFNFVKASLREGLRWVPQEPHDEELRRKVRLNTVTPFLLGLWRQGAFGSDPPEEVFTVKCDAENNPPAEVDLGNFRIEVYFYPTRPAETIVIVVGQQESGATAAES